jgi:hypothetical protein
MKHSQSYFTLSAVTASSTSIFSSPVFIRALVAIIGYIVLSILSRPNIIEPLKSRGLKVIDQGARATMPEIFQAWLSR